MSYFYRSNPTLEKAIDIFFEKLAEENDKKYNSKLSVMLLGSLSRGEGSWQYDKQGNVRILSDLEFFTVYPRGFSQFDDFQKTIDLIGNDVFGTQENILFYIDNTFIAKESLHKLERKEMTYDASVYGKCVVGEDVTRFLPKVTIKNINYEDIRDILAHRLFSVLYYGAKLKDNGRTEDYRYSLAKNSLDLMMVMLVKNAILESGFSNRLSALKRCNVSTAELDYFQYCLDIKLSNEHQYDMEISDMEKVFIDLVICLHKEFKIPLSNRIINLPYVIRRRLGMIKRGILKKKIFLSQERFIDCLIEKYITKIAISCEDITNSYVLNGYPRV
jgi:uncharacterized protein with HEPN domain